MTVSISVTDPAASVASSLTFPTPTVTTAAAAANDATSTTTTRMARTKTTTVITQHPFTRLKNPTAWESARMVLGLATGFVPLRLAVLLASVATLGSTIVGLHRIGLRSTSIHFLRRSCRWLLLVAGHVWIPIHGEDNERVFQPGHCPKIIVSNHVSNMEILHLLSLPFQDPSGNPVLPVFVTKETIFDVPFVGTIARDLMGCIGVTRLKRAAEKPSSNGASNNISSGKSCTEQILSRVRDGKSGPIVIFPEGTTTNGTCLLAFKKGAFAPMVPVRPVLYSFGTDAYDTKGSTFLPTYESIWGPAYLWRLLCQPIHVLSCEYLDPISPPAPESDTGQPDPASVFAEHARSVMAHDGNLPMVSSLYDYRHKLKYHAGLTKAFLSHPRGPKFAMCFRPMLPVFLEPPEGLPNGSDKHGKSSIKYDVVLGTKFVSEPSKDWDDHDDSDATYRFSIEKKDV